jgi:hypothetical protein
MPNTVTKGISHTIPRRIPYQEQADDYLNARKAISLSPSINVSPRKFSALLMPYQPVSLPGLGQSNRAR